MPEQMPVSETLSFEYSSELKYLHLLYNHGRHGKHGRIVPLFPLFRVFRAFCG